MKYTIPNCIGKLSNHKLNTFEFIISHQYRKFKIFYNLLKPFNSNIEKFCYIFMTKDILCVDISFDTNTNTTEVLKELQTSLKNENDEIVITYEVERDRLTIKIDMTEVDGYTEEEIKEKHKKQSVEKETEVEESDIKTIS